MGIHKPRGRCGIRLSQRPQNRDVVSAKSTRFGGRQGRVQTPRMLDFAGQPFGSEFAEPILNRARRRRAIKISQNEMSMCLAAGGITGSRFAVDQDGVGPCASSIKFQANTMCRFQYFRICAVRRWAKSEMMKRSGPRDRAVPQDFHVAQSALEVGRSRVPQIGESYEIILAFVQMRAQICGVAFPSTVFAASDDHAPSSQVATIVSRSRRSSSVASLMISGSISNPAFALRATWFKLLPILPSAPIT